MSANRAFNTARGEKMALELAKFIVQTEPVQNWDECLHDISEKVYRLGDKKYGVPVSAFVRAEEIKHLRVGEKKTRYKIKIMEEV